MLAIVCLNFTFATIFLVNTGHRAVELSKDMLIRSNIAELVTNIRSNIAELVTNEVQATT